MAFIPSRQRPVGRPRDTRPVLAVGQRVFVHSPSDRPIVVLMDERGVTPGGGLGDGAEVEVLAWRPRGSAGTRYRVRARENGSDGWLGADELRTTAARPAPQPAQSATTVSHGAATHRPFGQRG
ncbi:MAG TPA: hypothetical protein VMS22_15885 [Candidatus Eisenbacteria bacterium]|nr:hypothetical protein [Candidatus Eisenbacteria bacterium]